ncbi:MAG: hypothetical protein WB791_05960 [Waddliaceae bacterium]
MKKLESIPKDLQRPKAIAFFNREKLNRPCIAEKFLPKIREISPDVFGTRLNGPDIYDINACVQEVVSGPVKEYVLFGLGGHGIASLGMHYYVVEKGFALFLQISYGNAVLEEHFARERTNGQLIGVKLLYEAANHVQIPDGKRLLIVESDFYGSGWGWIEGYPGEVQDWQTDDPVFLHAINSILRECPSASSS